MAEKQEFKLPENFSVVIPKNPSDLVIVGIPKIGKSVLMGDFSKKYNAVILNLEKEAYAYIEGKIINIHISNETTTIEAYENYIKYRNLLLDNKGKYDYLLIDGLSDLDALSVIGGTYLYMFNSPQGKNFNRDKQGNVYKYGDENFKLVTDLGEGHGYAWSRKFFLDQIELFKQVAPHRIYNAHIADKLLRDGGKEEVNVSEIALTGKLKTIFASRVTALAKISSDEDKRYLNFDVMGEGILAGSRDPNLKGQILISEKDKKGDIVTHWDKIYK